MPILASDGLCATGEMISVPEYSKPINQRSSLYASVSDYFHSQVFDATLSLASVLCSKTPTVPVSRASFPVALVK